MTEKSIIIIGAGIGGLLCADERLPLADFRKVDKVLVETCPEHR
jgi:predicted NAD/FAD-dependent oxidoreductase